MIMLNINCTTNIRQEIYYYEQIKGSYKMKSYKQNIVKYYKCYKNWMITANTELQMLNQKISIISIQI